MNNPLEREEIEFILIYTGPKSKHLACLQSLPPLHIKTYDSQNK